MPRSTIRQGRNSRFADARRVTATTTEVRAEDVARASYGKLLAILAKQSGDIAGAEDALADAIAAA